MNEGDAGRAIPPQVPVPAGYQLRDVQLEMSLKPFFDNSRETREAVCREIFQQWLALTRHARQVSVLLWVAEGSEILEFDGRPETEFEWARWQGAPNRHRWEMPKKDKSRRSDHDGIGVNAAESDPEGKGLHSRAYLYRPEPAVFTYGWLRELVQDLKRIGSAITGKPVLVGQAFDIGPEFAISRFKFDWHREILGDGPVFKEQFISCEAVLNADDRRYAAFPSGIPGGTTIGEFLGRQVRALFDFCGTDFLWLSNGFGFALEPWALVGKVFDGEKFHPEEAAGTRDRILAFWDNLREAIGAEVNIRTRGTNMATGIDIGSDASPLMQIYANNPAVDAPVNSPWAALDGDFGLELSGWMSHMAVHPGETYRFRFYIHDPWWKNSPWLDRYTRQPHDLFLPLSISRLGGDGRTEIPMDLAFLTIDDSNGLMPLQVPNEVTANFLKARETAPDSLGPLVWLYPFSEYHYQGFEGGTPERPFHADTFIGTVINAGVPLNSVADAEILDTVLGRDPGILHGRIFLAPVPRPGSSYEALVRKMLAAGGSILFFGPLFPDSFLWRELDLRPGDPLSGDFSLHGEDCRLSGMRIRHLDFLSAGPWRECAGTGQVEGDFNTVYGEQDGQRRVAFRSRKTCPGGTIGWIRASLATGEFDPGDPAPIRGPILMPLSEDGFVSNGQLTCAMLKEFSWDLRSTTAPGESKRPYLTVHRWRNSCILSGYHRNETSSQSVRLPLGAPLLINRHNRIEESRNRISGEVAWKYEVRAFLVSGGDGTVPCRELCPLMYGVNRRILISGLRNAVLAILPDPAHLDTLRILVDPHFPYFLGEELPINISQSQGHQVIVTRPIDGELLLEW